MDELIVRNVDPQGTTWRDRAPASLTSAYDADGEPCPTPLDRRWLWRLEHIIALDARGGSRLHQVGRDLEQYLRETCEHHWRGHRAEADLPARRQCAWCHVVEWVDNQ